MTDDGTPARAAATEVISDPTVNWRSSLSADTSMTVTSPRGDRDGFTLGVIQEFLLYPFTKP
jgi:hypothetical protein